MPESDLKEGQRVWHKGRPAIFRYSLREGAAVVHFEGRPAPSVVSQATLSLAPPDDTGGRARRLSAWLLLLLLPLPSPPLGIDFPF